MQFFGGSEISPSPPVPTASGNNAHMMYVFNRNGVCLFYKEWNRPLHTLNPQQDHKLMFGLLFSLKSLTAKMDPVKFRISSFFFSFGSIDDFGVVFDLISVKSVQRFDDFDWFVWFARSYAFDWFLIFRSADKGNLGVPQLPGQGCSFHSFRTNTYKLSFMETPSGIKVSFRRCPKSWFQYDKCWIILVST